MYTESVLDIYPHRQELLHRLNISDLHSL